MIAAVSMQFQTKIKKLGLKLIIVWVVEETIDKKIGIELNFYEFE